MFVEWRTKIMEIEQFLYKLWSFFFVQTPFLGREFTLYIFFSSSKYMVNIFVHIAERAISISYKPFVVILSSFSFLAE